MLLSREDPWDIQMGVPWPRLLSPISWDRTFCTAQSQGGVLVAKVPSFPSHSQFKHFEFHLLCQGQVVSLPKEVVLLPKLLLGCSKVPFPLPFITHGGRKFPAHETSSRTWGKAAWKNGVKPHFCTERSEFHCALSNQLILEIMEGRCYRITTETSLVF